jgi:hypothetical protein
MCYRHVPKAKATIVADTPEMKRLAENSKIQSNVKVSFVVCLVECYASLICNGCDGKICMLGIPEVECLLKAKGKEKDRS